MTDTRTTVAVIGCGYVGYPLAVLAASAGYRVVGVDIDPSVVAAINDGVALTDEPGLVDLAVEVHATGRLTADFDPPAADVYVITVPTPVRSDGRTPDMSAVESAAARLAPLLTPGATVIVESTVAPGTCRDLVVPILESHGLLVGRDVHLAHCPERVLPGRTIDELTHGERVIGGIDAASTQAARSFYATFSKGELIETDLETAEFVKLMENTYRDVNVALANQIAELARRHGVDPYTAVRIANGHPRVDYLQPGIGVGGHCIPVDPWFLVPEDADAAGLILEARRVNDAQPVRVAERILRHLPEEGARVVLVGASYKPNVGDPRNAPASVVRDRLRAGGVDVVVHDPLVFDDGADLVERCRDADAVIVLVPHDAVLGDLATRRPEIEGVMRSPLILDARTGDVVPWAPGPGHG